MVDARIRAALQQGLVIPAHPLALTAERKLDERHQRALTRYYAAAGAGGLAVGVHTTQFAIHSKSVGLYEPVLALAAEELDRADAGRALPLVRIAGIVGSTRDALREASVARELGYHAGLVSLGALMHDDDDALIEHCRQVASVIPVFGFYLQPDAGGRALSHAFWRRFAEIENVVAIKVAPFNRYQTLDVVRAVAESRREDIALYTGNDDQIVMDLITPWRFVVGDTIVERRFVGGLLGHWAFWTRSAVELHRVCRRLVQDGASVDARLLALSTAITDVNAAVFDVQHRFAGCIPGILEMLRRQGLLAGSWCLDPDEKLSPTQSAEIDRVCRCYPQLADDAFVARHRDQWLRP